MDDTYGKRRKGGGGSGREQGETKKAAIGQNRNCTCRVPPGKTRPKEAHRGGIKSIFLEGKKSTKKKT